MTIEGLSAFESLFFLTNHFSAGLHFLLVQRMQTYIAPTQFDRDVAFGFVVTIADLGYDLLRQCVVGRPNNLTLEKKVAICG